MQQQGARNLEILEVRSTRSIILIEICGMLLIAVVKDPDLAVSSKKLIFPTPLFGWRVGAPLQLLFEFGLLLSESGQYLQIGSASAFAAHSPAKFKEIAQPENKCSRSPARSWRSSWMPMHLPPQADDRKR